MKFSVFFLLIGVAIGAGWQSVVVYVTLGCYYLIGIPVGVLLGYFMKLQVQVSFQTHFSLSLSQSLSLNYYNLLYL